EPACRPAISPQHSAMKTSRAIGISQVQCGAIPHGQERISLFAFTPQWVGPGEPAFYRIWLLVCRRRLPHQIPKARTGPSESAERGRIQNRPSPPIRTQCADPTQKSRWPVHEKVKWHVPNLPLHGSQQPGQRILTPTHSQSEHPGLTPERLSHQLHSEADILSIDQAFGKRKTEVSDRSLFGAQPEILMLENKPAPN